MSVTVTDLFCGAGGSSLGAELSGARLRLGLNHWDRAVETHAANFQHADHDCEDVASLTTARIRRYPDSDILLASPECTNHSLAKGARRRKPQTASLWDDGPGNDDEQDRSRATMWDVWRFAEQKILKGRPYKAIVVENVVDAFKWGPDDNGALFDAWLHAGTALGYQHETVFLNSMFAHVGRLVPQSRDRMYVVWWQRSMRAPNLRFDVASWCPRCERVVDGRQTWKRPDRRPWGRYGAQYTYGCPDCRGAVHPGAAPAMQIIDEALPAFLIGERAKPLAANTRERIRRGLERLDREPFAIRLMQGGAPRPLTLPLVTLTARHDMAMVTPVAGNTYERTPGNRARRADTQPLDTVHGTLDRAIVVPPNGDGLLRDADWSPSPTQTTTTRAAVVHTVRAGGHHHALVMANNGTGDGCRRKARCALPHEPIRTLTSGGHQSVVMAPTRDKLALIVPYDSTGTARQADFEPSPTLTTRDRAAVLWTDDDIDACRFRMFALHEIAGAMSMDQHTTGAEYIVLGNKRERMAQYGNAVTPPAMQLLVSRILPILDEAAA